MPPPASQLILHQVSRFLLPLGMHPYPCHSQGPAPALPPGLSTLVEGPAPAPSGHLPVSKQHRVCQHLRREEDGDALFLRPFILVLGSSLTCETWPGHERTASCQPHGSCDKWWLVAPSCLSQWGSEKLLLAKNMVNRNGTEFLPWSATLLSLVVPAFQSLSWSLVLQTFLFFLLWL